MPVPTHPTDKIRNVALVGHTGTGKTTLAEALLHRSGAIDRLGRVEDGTTTCDHDPEEHRRRQSLTLSVAPFEWNGHKVNLIDTPGYGDFIGQVEAALAVADLAVVVVSAVDGVQVQTEEVWHLAERLGVPRLLFVNKLDRERASFDRALVELGERLAVRLSPLELPLGAEAGFRGVADVLTEVAHVYEDGTPHTEPIPEELAEREHTLHDEVVEGIVMADDALLERYLEGEQPSFEELEHTLTAAMEAAEVFPVLCGSATAEIGIDRLADLLVEIGPPPGDRPRTVLAGEGAVEVEVAADADADPLAVVLGTIADPYVGQISVLKVLSGTIHDGDHLVNPRSGADERLHGLFTLRGSHHEPTDALVAGDIGAVTKLAGTATGDTLAPRSSPVVVPAPPPAAPAAAAALVAASQADEDRLATALHRLLAEDPHLTVERDDETHQTVLRGAGEVHLAVAVDRLNRRFGVDVGTTEVLVRYRETITAPAEAEGKHKKQSGGHGQFGVCTVRIEPLERGAGFEFEDRIVGGAVSRSYIPAVQKGIEEAMAAGGLHGFPVVDLRATLLDGKQHSVDSSEMAFKAAGRLAFRAALAEAHPVVLEPVVDVEVTVPAELQGDVLGDLTSRRGRVTGTDVGDLGEQVVTAAVPVAELGRYSADLRSITGGRGRFRLGAERYEPLPDHLVERIRRPTDAEQVH
jgi:elongation factor G